MLVTFFKFIVDDVFCISITKNELHQLKINIKRFIELIFDLTLAQRTLFLSIYKNLKH